jgi:transposase
VDVCSQVLDAKVWPNGPELQVKNTPQGVAELAAWCLGHGVELAVMEATGGYERQAFRLLWANGVAAAVVNPRQVRRFAEAMGVLEKTDRLDAGVIGWYAHAKGVEPETPPPAEQERLAALVTRLGQLTALKVSQENQRRLVEDEGVQASFTEVLRVVSGQIRRFEAEIAQLLQTDPLWRELDRTFRQTKGVADRSVARLMAEMPEIGTLTGKEVAKLAGLARWPTTPASTPGAVASVAAAPPSAACSTSSPVWSPVTSPTTSPSDRSSSTPESLGRSCASRSLESYSSVSTPRPGTPEPPSTCPLPLDLPDSRSPRCGASWDGWVRAAQAS